MPKYALAFALLIGFAAPAVADYYIVQNISTKQCSIVDKKHKPAEDNREMIIIGTKNYKTVEEAEAKMKTHEACLAPKPCP